MRQPFCLDVRFDLPKLTFQLELDKIAVVFLLACYFADTHGKTLFLGIQVLLNAVGVLLGPFIGLAISHKVIVGQVG